MLCAKCCAKCCVVECCEPGLVFLCFGDNPANPAMPGKTRFVFVWKIPGPASGMERIRKQGLDAAGRADARFPVLARHRTGGPRSGWESGEAV